MGRIKKNSRFNVMRQNETPEGFLDLTGYISQADEPMEYIDYLNEKVTREVIPLEELEKASPQATGLIMTDNHPWEFLNSSNATLYTRGFVINNYGIEDKKIKVDIRVIDKDVIKDIKLGKKEQFSIGYYCDIIEEPGITETGERYDVKQVALKLNHFSIVPTGRAGEKIGIIKLNNKDENVSYEKGMFKKENGGDEKMAIKYNGKDMEAAELHAELILRDKELIQKTNEAEALKGEMAGLKTTNEELVEKVNGIDNKVNSEVVARLNSVIEVAKMTGEDTDDLLKLNSVELKKKVINSAFPNMDLEGKTEAFLEGLYEGAKTRLNSTTPLVTEGDKKSNVEKKNGIDLLKQAVEGIGGKK